VAVEAERVRVDRRGDAGLGRARERRGEDLVARASGVELREEEVPGAPIPIPAIPAAAISVSVAPRRKK
jgi:hypothetical protein